ncbi:hypothetical protein V757_03085 [Pelistega indica]|uniref:O-antigen ligase-related domain-containing protein n=1 Tax=Pelistega indica TaxID=1414851 RepID=V8G7Y6_9BURK|nr:O-antigen ligase family protein [Pelistega indica]ETD72649.1 hypothetical protein V757_03085 [Pelistega indica]
MAIILLLLTSIYVVIRYRKDIDFSKGRPLAVIFLLYACVVILANLFGGHGDRDYESPARFLLAIPIVYAMTYIRVNRTFLMVCIALGAIAMGVLAVYQVYDVHYYKRAGLYPIRFGNIGMLVAFFCVAGLIFFPKESSVLKKYLLKSGLLLGVIFGIVASILSGTRGGWLYPLVGIPIISLFLISSSSKILRDLCILFTVTIGLVGFVYLVPNIGIEKRIHQAITEVEKYEPNAKSSLTSIGGRFEMWRLAINLIKEKPFVGWGTDGYRERMKLFVEQKEARSVVLHRHPHNEILNEASKRGIFSSLIVILGFYLYFFSLFVRKYGYPDDSIRCYSILGCLMIAGWVVFGLTDVFLEHHQMIVYFIFYITLFFGGINQKVTNINENDVTAIL